MMKSASNYHHRRDCLSLDCFFVAPLVDALRLLSLVSDVSGLSSSSDSAPSFDSIEAFATVFQDLRTCVVAQSNTCTECFHRVKNYAGAPSEAVSRRLGVF